MQGAKASFSILRAALRAALPTDETAIQLVLLQKRGISHGRSLLRPPLQESAALHALLGHQLSQERERKGQEKQRWGVQDLALSEIQNAVPNHLLASSLQARRQIYFLRFLSDSRPNPKRLGLPDAADADQALQDYLALRQRLESLQRPSTIKSWGQIAMDVLVAVKNGLLATGRFLVSVPGRVSRWMSMPKEEWQEKKKKMWGTVKHEAHHYWVGTKLLGYEIRIASRHALKAAQGKTLTRRERAQLTRTTADLFRLVPMIIIVVIPFLEFALPVLLRLFPNMLPSTFEDKLKKEEELKRRLAIRLELAKFLQDTVAEMAKDIARRRGGEDGSKEADELAAFIQKVRTGREVDNAEIIRFARLFNDELTLDNLERLQLVGMCQFVGISPFGTDAFLRSRLRAHLQKTKQDDYAIEQEGIENLTEDELRSACRARGMRAPYGEGAVRFMQRQLRDWLDLSLHRGLPSSLLLLSRAFTITAAPPPGADLSAAKDAQYAQLKETLGVIPPEVVESVEAAAISGASGVRALQARLEFLKREEEAIREELERAVAAERAAAAQHVLKTDAQVAAEAAAAGEAQVVAAEAAAAAGPAREVAKAVAAKLDDAAAKAAAAVRGEGAEVSAEEAEAAAKEAREAKVRQIVSAMLDLVSGSGVAQERRVFMGLLRNEMDRVNQVLATAGTSGRMTFSAKGLEVEKPAAVDEEGRSVAPGDEQRVQRRLSDRVSKMLASIEQELDQVESKIGHTMHVLDTDGDGIVTQEELEQALRFLRQELKPEDLKQLLRELKAAAAAAPKEQPDLQHAASSLKAATAVATGLPVSELLTLAQQAESSGNGEESKAGEGSRSSNGGGSKAATASGRA